VLDAAPHAAAAQVPCAAAIAEIDGAAIPSERYCHALSIAMLWVSKRTAPASTDEKPTKRIAPMSLARSFQTWRQYRNTAAELNRLSQRELADLGISRSEIPALARQSVR